MLNLIPRRKTGMAPARRGGETTMFEEFPKLFQRMRNEMMEAFDRMNEEWPMAFPVMALPTMEKEWKWGVEMKDEPAAIIVKAEAPGFEAGDFNLEVRGQELILRASKKTTKEEKKEKEGKEYHEEEVKEYYEAVMLPAEVNAEKVEAKYHQGILTVTLPKTEKGKGKAIPVTSA